MDHSILSKDHGDIVSYILDEDEEIKTKPNSVLSQTNAISKDTTYGDKNAKETLKVMVRGKKFVTQVVKSNADGQTVMLAPQFPGEILAINPASEGVSVSSLCFLAADSQSQISVTSNNLYRNSAIGNLHIENANIIHIAGFSNIIDISLDEGQTTTVREDYLIGYENTVTATKDDSILLSTERELSEIQLEGPGTLYMQTRSPSRFSETIGLLTE